MYLIKSCYYNLKYAVMCVFGFLGQEWSNIIKLNH